MCKCNSRKGSAARNISNASERNLGYARGMNTATTGKERSGWSMRGAKAVSTPTIKVESRRTYISQPERWLALLNLNTIYFLSALEFVSKNLISMIERSVPEIYFTSNPSPFGTMQR